MSGCSTLSYLIQAGLGQLKLSNRAVSIEDVIQNPKTPEIVKRHLIEVDKVKKWGEITGLKPTNNYKDYVALDDQAVVWVVSACQELKFEAHTWAFPLVGSFTYLGWFAKDRAVIHANELKNEGYDTDVRGAQAYSTLGWFKDSVLSSMIGTQESSIGDLVNIIIHESTHATLYIDGQSTFNESLANFVADLLTPKYLEQEYGKNSNLLIQYIKSKEDAELRLEKFRHTYSDLELLYSSSLQDSEKRLQKQKLLNSLEAQVQAKRGINNATLVQFKTYESDQDTFLAVFKACGEDLNRFLKVLKSQALGGFSGLQHKDIKSFLESAAKSCRI